MSQLAKTYQLSRIPLYVQVATALRRRIEEGQWAPGDKISTLEELQAEFEVARVTVRQAVDLLQKEGLVRRQQGKGTFVAAGLRDRRWLKLETTWSALINTIKDNVPKFIPAKNAPPEPRLAPEDGRPAAEYVFLRSVQSRDNEPYGLANVHLAREVYERAPNLFRSQTALSVLAELKGVHVAAAHQTLMIGTADTETADLLKIPLNSPTAEAHCVVIDRHGTAIYVGDITYRGDCIRLNIDLFGSMKA
ncbi:MAG TPA: GntR family transcriptional regulator [Alphaproteobacteria bacterium]|nr:GntR family transcriptional regulator [Alphaproteobacteria bacterium]